MDISTLGSAAATASTTREQGFSALGSDDFTKLIFAELTNQDPLAPSDTGTLVQQISDIRAIQSDMDLSDRLGDLVGRQEFTAASSTIGKLVSGVSDEDGRVTDIVKSVIRTDEGTLLALANGSLVAFDKVDVIREPNPPAQPQTQAATAPPSPSTPASTLASTLASTIAATQVPTQSANKPTSQSPTQPSARAARNEGA